MRRQGVEAQREQGLHAREVAVVELGAVLDQGAVVIAEVGLAAAAHHLALHIVGRRTHDAGEIRPDARGRHGRIVEPVLGGECAIRSFADAQGKPLPRFLHQLSLVRVAAEDAARHPLHLRAVAQEQPLRCRGVTAQGAYDEVEVGHWNRIGMSFTLAAE